MDDVTPTSEVGFRDATEFDGARQTFLLALRGMLASPSMTVGQKAIEVETTINAMRQIAKLAGSGRD